MPGKSHWDLENSCKDYQDVKENDKTEIVLGGSSSTIGICLHLISNCFKYPCQQKLGVRQKKTAFTWFK